MGTSFYPAQGGGGGSSYITSVSSTSSITLSVVGSNLSATIAALGITNGMISNSAAIVYSKLALTNSIVNADIAAAAGIVDTKLATISTAGKVANSATTATNLNTASAIVARDGSGNFSAGTITANLTGTATDALNANFAVTAGDFSGSLSGDVTGTQSATAISSTTVTSKLLTGFVSGAGTVAATDSILDAFEKLDGNVALRAPLASPTFTGTVRISSLATGIAHFDASGNISSALIDNVDVSASAAIAGTKISPNFGSQNLVTTGTGSFASLAATGTAGAGFIDLGPQSSAPAASAANTVRLYSNATGGLVWRGSGTNIVTFVAPAAAQTYTFPASTSTLAVLGLAQTFSALQTFSAGITASGSVATTISSTGGLVVSATAGSGRLQLNAQSAAPTGTASNASVYADASGNLSFKAGTTAGAIFTASANTAVRSYTLPDLAGTFAISGTSQNWSTSGTLAAGATSITGSLSCTGAFTVSPGQNVLLQQSGLNAGSGLAVEATTGTLYVRRNVSGSAVTSALFYGNGILAGEIRMDTTGLTIAFVNASDYRLKSDIVDASPVLDKFERLQPRSFTWNQNGYRTELGFIAHELKEVFPIAVDGEKDGVNDKGEIETQMVGYGRLIPYLMAAVKELSGKIKTLNEKVTMLESVVGAL